jgi:biotin operon repressor
MNKNEKYYQEITRMLEAHPILKKDMVAVALGISHRNLSRVVVRLKANGYDMSNWEARMQDNLSNNNSRRKVEYKPRINLAEYYLILMKALKVSGRFDTKAKASEMLGLNERSVTRIASTLKSNGYDMADWEARMRDNRKNAYYAIKEVKVSEGRKQPNFDIAKQRESVVLARAKWLSDMREVASKQNPRLLLEKMWNTNQDTIYSRISLLRGSGHDLSWWVISPSTGFGNADQALEARLEGVRQAKLRRKEISLNQETQLEQAVIQPEIKWVPKRQTINNRMNYLEIPYTVYSVAEILGVSVNRVMFIARGLGVPFSQFVLPTDMALRIMESMGIITIREVAC